MPKATRAIKKSDANAPWNRRKHLSDLVKDRYSFDQSFLIVCDGQTESSYFNSFKLKSCSIKCVSSSHSKIGLVEYAAALSHDEAYDQVWCVFDMDFSQNRPREKAAFDNAISKAEKLGFRVAWSNDCFELWFYLHYKEQSGHQLRNYYYRELKRIWKMKRSEQWKEKDEAKKNFERLVSDPKASQSNAIKRAEKLMKGYDKHIPPHKKNPGTMVYELVKEMKGFLGS